MVSSNVVLLYVRSAVLDALKISLRYTFFLSITVSYRILPHSTAFYRILPLFTETYRILPIGGSFAVPWTANDRITNGKRTVKCKGKS